MTYPRHQSRTGRANRFACALVASGALALCPVVGVCLSGAVEARVELDSGPVDEYALKAAFLYNFARYTKWPDTAFVDADAPIVLGVLGKDPFGVTLDKAFQGKAVGKRKFSIQRFDSIEKLSTVHLLFVPSTEGEQLDKLRAHYADKPVMLVADSLAGAERGAHIGLYFEKSKVRFAVNSTAIKAAKLEVSSELLKLGKIVETPAKEARQ